VILDYRQTKCTSGFIRVQSDGGYGRDQEEIESRSTCPFCHLGLELAFYTRDWPDVRWYEDENDSEFSIYACANCGWWNLYSYVWCDTATVSSMTSYHEAVLRTFDVSSAEIPVQTLQDYLIKNENRFYEVNPSKFEELVSDVFRDFFACEAKHVGRTGDGGIDLIVVDSDSPLAVQIKRRRDPEATEKVKTIREFLGAALLEGFKRAAIVTTARSFTKGARAAAQSAVTHSIVDQFDLFDFSGFIEIFRLSASRQMRPPWTVRIPDNFLNHMQEHKINSLAKKEAYYAWQRAGRHLLSKEEQDRMYFEAMKRIEINAPHYWLGKW